MIASGNRLRAADTASNGKLAGIRVYPNPAREECTVTFSGAFTGTGSLEVMDENGRVLIRRAVYAAGSAGGFRQRLNLRGLSTGIYYVKVINTNGIQISKLAIQH